MILHIGNGKTVKEKRIIGVFDLDNATVSAATRAFLACATKKKRVEYGDRDIPRSFLLLDGEALPAEKGDAREKKNKREGALRRPGEKRGTAQGKREKRPFYIILSHISSRALAARAAAPLLGEEE